MNMLFFQSRAEFWQQQKPMYARKGKSAKQGTKRDKGDPAKYILKCLEDIDEGVKILTRLIPKHVSLCYHPSTLGAPLLFPGVLSRSNSFTIIFF